MTRADRRRSEVTRDTFFDGAVVLEQPARGYRVNVDALLLAAFAAASGPARRLIDLGAGVGAVTLALGHLTAVEHATCVEADRALGSLCGKNLARARQNGTVVTADLGRGLPATLAASADLVVCNPPFFEPSERRPARGAREASRAGALEPFLVAARASLGKHRPRAAFIYPARTLVRLLRLAEQHGLVAKRMRFVHARVSEPARVALVELKPAKPGGLVVEPPLVEWSEDGARSSELAALSAGRASGRK